jgi:hypothetical protein
MTNQSARIEAPIGNRQSEIGTGLRPSQVRIERELEVVSHLMDEQFRLPVLGWRFGLNAIIDLVPEVGDIATSIVALYVLVSAVRYRVPKVTLLRMGVNIAIYFIVGLIPWLGDLFGAWWKPNIRNLNLLRRRATVSAEQAKQGRASDWLFVGLIIVTLLSLLFACIAFTGFFFWYLFRNFSLVG